MEFVRRAKELVPDYELPEDVEEIKIQQDCGF